MKYFTPDLVARCRSLDDDVAEVAAEEWEQATSAYRARLEGIRRVLPSGVRRLLSRSSLHDAKVLGVSFGNRKPRFSLLVRLEATAGHPHDVLELSYRPVAGPHGGVAVRKHTPFEQNPLKSVWILYNEFDVDEERAFFTHSLLLTDGQEIRVRFHSFRVRYVDEIVSPVDLTEEERTWPLGEVRAVSREPSESRPEAG